MMAFGDRYEPKRPAGVRGSRLARGVAETVVAAILCFAGGGAWGQSDEEPYHTSTFECGSPPAGGGSLLCDASTYALPVGADHRGNISYYFEDDDTTTRDDDYDYTVTIDGASLGELRYLSGDTSVEQPSLGKLGVIDIHGGRKTGKQAADDSLTDADLTIVAREVTVNATTAAQNNVRGIFTVLSGSSGDLRLDVIGGSYRTGSPTTSDGRGISAVHDGSGDLFMTVTGAAITTKGESGIAVDAWHDEFGGVDVAVTDAAITTEGDFGYGVRAYLRHNDIRNQDVPGDAQPTANTPGHIHVHVTGTDIHSKGLQAWGIYANHANHANVRDPANADPSHGDIDITVTDARIRTEAAFSSGIYVNHGGIGDVDIAVERNAAITTRGTAAEYGGQTYTGGSHGIFAAHTNQGAIDVAVRRGATVSAQAANDYGIVVNGKSTDDDGYVRQTVRVDGSVAGNGGGMQLQGGGRVFVGLNGFVDGGSSTSTAIESIGSAARLAVDVQLDCASRQALNGRIVNRVGPGEDAVLGSTVVSVNGFDVYDGTKAIDRRIPHGIRDITMPAPDVEAESGMLAVSLNEGAVDCLEAARGGVYEALPGFLWHMDQRDGYHLRQPEPGTVWVDAAGGAGNYTPERTTYDAKYDLWRIAVEAGTAFSLAPRVQGTLAFRHVRGWADVSSRAGDGRMEAMGLGAALGAAWRTPGGFSLEGWGSFTGLWTDASTTDDGVLVTGVRSTALSAGLQAAYRSGLGGGAALTPNAWVVHSRLGISPFEDRVRSNVSLPQEERHTIVGGGVTAELDVGGAGPVTLRGSAGVAHVLGDGTTIDISGERLMSEGNGTRTPLGIGAVVRVDRVVFDAALRANVLGLIAGSNQSYGGSVGVVYRY